MLFFIFVGDETFPDSMAGAPRASTPVGMVPSPTEWRGQMAQAILSGMMPSAGEWRGLRERGWADALGDHVFSCSHHFRIIFVDPFWPRDSL